MNNGNLIPNTERSPEEVRENGRLGGIKSGIARRKKKNLQDHIKAVMDMPLTFKQRVALRKRGVKAEDMPENMMALWAMSVVDTGILTGDGKDITKIAELSGQYIPKKKLEVDIPTGPRKVINIFSVSPKAIGAGVPDADVLDVEAIEVKPKAIEGGSDE